MQVRLALQKCAHLHFTPVAHGLHQPGRPGSAVVLATTQAPHRRMKAALWGFSAGTLPDLDHRPWRPAAQHGAPPGRDPWPGTARAGIGPGLAGRPPAGQPDLWRRWWLAMALALITHPLLDTPDGGVNPVAAALQQPSLAVGSVFIIDPFYTLPLLLGVLVAVIGSSTRGCAGMQPCWRSAPPTWVECAGTAACARRSGGLRCVTTEWQPARCWSRPPPSTVCCGVVNWGPSTTTKRITLCWMARTRCLDIPPARRRSAPAARRQPHMCNGCHGSATGSAHTGEQPGAAHHHRPAHGAGAPILPLRHRPGPLCGERDRPSGSAMAVPLIFDGPTWLWRRLTDPRLATFHLPGGISCGTAPEVLPAHSRQGADGPQRCQRTIGNRGQWALKITPAVAIH